MTPNNQTHFLAYGLPMDVANPGILDSGSGIKLEVAPLGANTSFLNYAGVIIFAGIYERRDHGNTYRHPSIICSHRADLSLRVREAASMLQQGRPLIFLVGNLDVLIDCRPIPDDVDLFRSVMANQGIRWQSYDGSSVAHSEIGEFDEYISRYGMGWITCSSSSGRKSERVTICRGDNGVFGEIFGGQMFLLPAVPPSSGSHAVEMTFCAVKAVVAYRNRISAEPPGWIEEFVFAEESRLSKIADEVRAKLEDIQKQLSVYSKAKEALYSRSDVLVRSVIYLLDHYFGICVVVMERYIEDGVWKDENGDVLAVFEIKGINGNFRRSDINQVDSHRDRLELPASIPGVLIMNTMMSSESLVDKDQSPHPDIIKKASVDNVLLLRTIDLLRLIDAVEQSQIEAGRLREAIVGGGGWLRVENNCAELIRGS